MTTELETALARYMAELAIDREEAIRRILTEWLRSRRYLGSGDESVHRDVAETVQYPEFMDDASGGAGG